MDHTVTVVKKCVTVCVCVLCVYSRKAGLLSSGLQLLCELSVQHALCVDVKSLQQPITAAFSFSSASQHSSPQAISLSGPGAQLGI